MKTSVNNLTIIQLLRVTIKKFADILKSNEYYLGLNIHINKRKKDSIEFVTIEILQQQSAL